MSVIRTCVLTGAACLLTALSVHGQVLVMEKSVIRDSYAVHKEAVSFLKPKGWNVTGGIKWYPNLAHQACVEVKVNNPGNLEQFEALPYATCTWITNPIVPMARGSNYLGSLVEPPTEDPKEYVRRYSLPLLRKGTNARITGYQELPDIAKELARFHNTNVRAGRTRVEYTLNGKTVEEDFYVSLFSVSMSLGVNNSVSTIWGPAWTPFALRAEKGKLNAATPKMLAIANSARIDPYWFGEYSYVCQLFMQRMRNGIENARRLSETITRNSEEIRKMFSESYRLRQESQDRISRNFSNYIRGVEEYHSPYENYPVQLPSGYSHAWAGSNGTYILTNEAGYNPNVGSTITWKPMEVVK